MSVSSEAYDDAVEEIEELKKENAQLKANLAEAVEVASKWEKSFAQACKNFDMAAKGWSKALDMLAESRKETARWRTHAETVLKTLQEDHAIRSRHGR